MFQEGELSPAQQALVQAAREKAHILYEGKQTPHRSCGVCLAETFGLRWQPFQALRRGGLTGEGSCGAIRAGELVLGEILGPPSPEDPPTERLRDAIVFYQRRWKDRQEARGWYTTICNSLVAPFPDFKAPERAGFCTSLAEESAELVAEALVRAGEEFEIVPVK